MAITKIEGRFRALLMLWLVLFGVGTIVVGVGAILTGTAKFYADNPWLVYVLGGQVVLFLCSDYLFSGIRDNELIAPAITCYKLVSGLTMVVFGVNMLGWSSREGTLTALGGLLDLVMGGLTVALWLSSRRSRVLRMPTVWQIDPNIDEEPDNASATWLRTSLAIFSVICGVGAVVLFLTRPYFIQAQTSTIAIAAGNAIGVYAAVSFLSMLAAESPYRRRYLLDVVTLCSLVLGALLMIWTVKYQLDQTTLAIYLIAGAGHLAFGAIFVYLTGLAEQTIRPGKFFGPWLQRVFERFAEVVIRGRTELLTPREFALTADELLASIPSSRLAAIKIALTCIEFGSLLRFRAPMSKLGRLEREQYLSSLFQQDYGPFRQFTRIRQLVYFIYYSDPQLDASIGFKRFPERHRYEVARDKHALPHDVITYPEEISGQTVETDVCVIGSGAGGAVMAARLAEAGQRVVIVEEGPFLKRDRIVENERVMQARAYRGGGLQLSVDFDLNVLQGRCVGGSTFLNNGICFDLSYAKLAEWQTLGTTIDIGRLQCSYGRVRREIGVKNLAGFADRVEKGSFKFMEGCQKLGLAANWFDVNLGDCLGCGYCVFGCAYEKKMSMDRSYLPKALCAGGRLVSDCKAQSIAHGARHAREVKCVRKDGTPLTIQARKIVVACGPINSSLLLQRSGITHNVGTRLSFNLGTWVFAEFLEPVDSFDGIQMCAYHERPNYMLETFAMSPGTFAAAMPGWSSSHFERMRRYRYFCTGGALIGSEPVGWVKPSALGKVFSPIHFTTSISDLKKLRDGVRQLCRVYLNAGAVRVIPATANPIEFSHPSQLYALDETIIEPDDMTIGSSHPQGGNPMSDDPAMGAVDSRFRVHGFDNLFVCDASVFPSSIQINPQLTVMALADYASTSVLEA